MEQKEDTLLENEKIRSIQEQDDAGMAEIVRYNLEKYHLNIPGTAYFDPELDHLSQFYHADPEHRMYVVVEDINGSIIGGVGIAEFEGIESCAELQKLYLADAAKGKGLGRRLLNFAEVSAKNKGYRYLYLETHSALKEAIHLYQKAGFEQIEKPDCVKHGTMDTFYWKKL